MPNYNAIRKYRIDIMKARVKYIGEFNPIPQNGIEFPDGHYMSKMEIEKFLEDIINAKR